MLRVRFPDEGIEKEVVRGPQRKENEIALVGEIRQDDSLGAAGGDIVARADLLPDGRRLGGLVSVGQGGTPGLEEMVVGMLAVEVCIKGIVINAFRACSETPVNETVDLQAPLVSPACVQLGSPGQGIQRQAGGIDGLIVGIEQDKLYDGLPGLERQGIDPDLRMVNGPDGRFGGYVVVTAFNRLQRAVLAGIIAISL